MAVSHKRYRLAQESERDYWDVCWKDNQVRQDNAKEYWHDHITLLRKHVNLKPSDRLLDIGCGPCGMIAYLDAAGPTAVPAAAEAKRKAGAFCRGDSRGKGWWAAVSCGRYSRG